MTGDTVVTKKLQDFNIETTFYKRFPFWIGFDIKNIRDKIGGIQIIMRNDGNQIIPGHRYELFYYNGKWISLGRKKATHTYVDFSDIPCNALLLLKCLTSGKEVRIFMYEKGKQLWF